MDQGNPTAGDSNSGTEASPWLTIGKAAATLKAGETVYIKAGIYNEAHLRIANSGTAGNPITLQAYPGHEANFNGSTFSGVWLDGTGKTWATRDSLLQISGQFAGADRHYIKVSGLGFRNVLGHPYILGIALVAATDVTVENCYFYNISSSGIYVEGGSNIIIDNNKLELCQRGVDGTGFSARVHENLTVFGTQGFKITNNHIFNSPGAMGRAGIDTKDGANFGEIAYNVVQDIGGSAGIYVGTMSADAHDIEVHHNTVFNCGFFPPGYTGNTAGQGIGLGSEQGGKLYNFSIHDNIVYNNTLNGIGISAYLESGYTDRGIWNVDIYNNTCYNNGISGIALVRRTMHNIDVYQNMAYNNAFRGIHYLASVAAEIHSSGNVNQYGNPVVPAPVS